MKGRLLVRALSVLAAVALGLGGWSFAGFVSGIERAEHAPRRPADAIVALTGGAQRIEDAVDLLTRGYGTRLLITGVNERTTRAEIARLKPAQREWLECCVDLDYRARNTLGNANETRRWARRNGFRSLIVVTSNYHMPRTLAEFDHALPEVSKIAHPVVSGSLDGGTLSQRIAAWRLLGGEYVKYLGTRLRTALTPARTDLADREMRVAGAPASSTVAIPIGAP